MRLLYFCVVSFDTLVAAFFYPMCSILLCIEGHTAYCFLMFFLGQPPGAQGVAKSINNRCTLKLSTLKAFGPIGIIMMPHRVPMGTSWGASWAVHEASWGAPKWTPRKLQGG